MLRPLVGTLRRICGVTKPRMAILPGQGGTVNLTLNMFRVLTGNYAKLGETKVKRMLQYALLFPEYAGQFVFLGDDGQADAGVAAEMLGLSLPSAGSAEHLTSASGLSSGCAPLVAFVAVHAVQQGESHVVKPEQRKAFVEELRRRFPPDSDSSGSLHRFFYFVDYEDLAAQLAEAGWFTEAQRDAVFAAAKRDRLPDLRSVVGTCNLRLLRSVLSSWCDVGECDEVELDAFSYAGSVLPDMVRAHIRLAVPPVGTSFLKLHVLKAAAQKGAERISWPTMVGVPGDFEVGSTPSFWFIECVLISALVRHVFI